MEVILWHQLHFMFSPNSEGRRGAMRTQTITDNINGLDSAACSEVQKGGRDDTDTGCWGIMGQKGVWTADQLTFLYTALATGNQGQL